MEWNEDWEEDIPSDFKVGDLLKIKGKYNIFYGEIMNINNDNYEVKVSKGKWSHLAVYDLEIFNDLIIKNEKFIKI